MKPIITLPLDMPTIKLTDKAAAVLQKQLAEHKDATHVRLGLKAACKGFGYIILFENTPLKEKDTTFEFGELKLVVDPKSLSMLDGLVIDWEESLTKKSFTFNNPNTNKQLTCGCGKSFTPTKQEEE